MNSGSYVATNVDITEELEYERALDAGRHQADAANRAKSAFLANMSHEIRTPLNGILGMAQVLGMTLTDPEQSELAETILASGNMLKTILDDVLDLSKIEAGRMEVAPIEDNLRKTLAMHERLWKPLAQQKGVDFVIEIDDAIPEKLIFDPVRLGQCVSNLLSNAVKFTSEGQIAMRVAAKAAEKSPPHQSKQGPQPETGQMDAPQNAGAPPHDPAECGGALEISIAIADNGIGISPAAMEKLFRPFAQAEDSISRRFGGTGLGLVICRKLVQLMGGDVTVDSQEGRGSTFTLTFIAGHAAEATAAPAKVAAALPNAAASGQIGPLILVADDHDISRRVVKMMLKPLGYRVVEAADGQETLNRLAEQSFDLVLLDINMPVMGGLEALQHMRAPGAPTKAIPAIAITAETMVGDRERFLSLGMDGYVSKPVERDALVAEVARVMAEKNNAKSAEQQQQQRSVA
jgi:signal transduction histidine kinase/AmiR/NasT family two-component response regulator